MILSHTAEYLGKQYFAIWLNIKSHNFLMIDEPSRPDSYLFLQVQRFRRPEQTITLGFVRDLQCCATFQAKDDIALDSGRMTGKPEVNVN